MIEKFSDYEGGQFLNQPGRFVFTVENAEIKDSSKGDPMVVLTVKAPEGTMTLYKSLVPKARWSYNNLIKACLHLNTIEKINNFQCDYMTIHNDLIGKKFIGTVVEDVYNKEVKTPLDDGTFQTEIVPMKSYKITKYEDTEIEDECD